MNSTPGWDDDLDILPDMAIDETAERWGEGDDSNDPRLIEERPPHWE